MCLPPGRGRTGCLPCPDRKTGYSGALCSRLSTSPPLPILDDPAPHMVEQLPDVLRFFRALSPEDVSLRTAVREPQLVEQLVEVPTIVSWSMLQQIMEQNVDIPVVDRGSGAGGGLSGFLPGQNSLTCRADR